MPKTEIKLEDANLHEEKQYDYLDLDELLSNELTRLDIKDRHKFTLIIKNKKLDVWLNTPDLEDFREHRTIIWTGIFEKCKASNLDKVPYNHDEYIAHYNRLSPEQQKDSTPPLSRAHQFADSASIPKTIFILLPEYFEDESGKKLLIGEKLKKFRLLVSKDAKLREQLVDIYLSLIKLENDSDEKLKNSSSEKSADV